MFRNGLEPWHLILVVVVFVLLFGYKKMPDAARGLGKSLRILKSETRALREDGKETKESSAHTDDPAERPVRSPEVLDATTTRTAPGGDPVRDEHRTV